jgi:hypothetical protein
MQQKMRERVLVWVSVALAVGCDVDRTGEPTGGVDVERREGCAAGVVTVLSDFVSTQVALSALDGTTLSESFLSTASTEASGVSFALSGDVALPSDVPPSGRVVLLDRYGTNVVTWADPATGEVLAQLAVGTGFESNPQDYLELDGERAYVSRWGQNGEPGREPFDRGGDLLIIDTARIAIVGRIELPGEGELPPRPAGMARVGQDVAVTLQRLALDFATAGESVVAGVSPEVDAIVWEHRLTGLTGCGGAAPAPSAARFAVACAGTLDLDGNLTDLSESGIVLFDATATPPRELRRFSAQELAGEAVQGSVRFIDEDRLLFKTQTPLGGAMHNRLLMLDVSSGAVTELAEARPAADGTGQGVTYGGLFCALGCSDVCLMADADLGVLQRWRVLDESLDPMEPVRVETQVGLPPRSLGGF